MKEILEKQIRLIIADYLEKKFDGNMLVREVVDLLKEKKNETMDQFANETISSPDREGEIRGVGGEIEGGG